MILDIDVTTPCGIFKGVEKNELAACAVSIIRAGDSMLQVTDSYRRSPTYNFTMTRTHCICTFRQFET